MAEVQSDDPLIGVSVGNYRISKLIGQGGMGRVYAAIQPEVGTRVAIKVLNEEYAREPELAERFFAEARAVATIAHENIVSVIDLVRLADGRPVIVMELLEGSTLRDVVASGRAPIGAVVHVMMEVLGAIGAAHGAGIVHRDLKPDNIVVLPSGRAKVLDFGIAKLMTPRPGSAPRTRTGAIIGTPEYMAPEQISGRGVDARTDIYSAGVVLYEALTGRRPFAGESDFEVMRAHVDQMPPSVRQRRPEVSAELEAIVMRALAKKQDDRFATAIDMANALQAASVGLPEAEWRAFSPSGREYSRPVPLTPIQPRALPPDPEAHDDADVPSTVDARGGSAPRRASADLEGAPTVLDKPRRSAWPLVAASIVAAAAIGGIVTWRLTRHHVKPPVYPNGAATKTIDKVATYDPKHFDPIAYYPTAQELARALIPDAELMFLKATPAHADGTIDLTIADAKQNVYLFRSASQKPNEYGQRDCIGVEPYAEKTTAFVYPSTECDFPLAKPPKCTVAEVWAQAQARRPFTEDVAHVGFFGDENGPAYWYVDPSMGRRTGAGIRVEDACR